MARKSIQLVTPEFRVSFPNVFVAKKNDLSGLDEYSLVALFKKGEDLAALKKAAADCIVEKWGPNKAKWPKNLRSPFRDQGEREKEDDAGAKFLPDGYEKGAIYVNMKSSRQPGIVDQKRQPILDGEKFYAGCYARADVSVYAYEKMGNAGVSIGLNNLQLVRDGEPFSGRRKAEEAFTAIESADGEKDASQMDDPFAA